MHYVYHKNKKLYFPKNLNKEQIACVYNGLITEQDEYSPHRYETSDYTVKSGDIIADIGTAEGMWALENIEKAKIAYLFECEKPWIQALQKTFEPWKEKIIIVNKFVSDRTKGDEVKLDDFFQNKSINFIKADIDVAEIEMISGAGEILKRKEDLRLLLCSYHKENDAKQLEEILISNGFSAEFSKGYMIFSYDKNLKKPYYRRGLIRAKNY